MAVLALLTIIYAGVLVIALAAVLTLILSYLWRIGWVLGRARQRLQLVADRTGPLRDAVAPLEEAINAHARDLETAGRHMAVVRDALQRAREEAAQGSAA